MFHWRGLQTKLLCNPLFLAEKQNRQKSKISRNAELV